MSTSIAISSVANAAAATANSQAREARKDACQALLNAYDAKAATVPQMKTYAECVQLLHPDPATNTETLVMKGLFVSLLIGLIVGVIWGWLEDGITTAAMFGILGALLLPTVIGCVLGLGMGVVWLFS